MYPMAWEKVNGVYMDDTGAPIEGAVLRGISVSKWQGDVDWGKVAADDVSFALIRMGSFGYEGEYTMDEYYDVNMREAKANGTWGAPTATPAAASTIPQTGDSMPVVMLIVIALAAAGAVGGLVVLRKRSHQ